MNDGRFHATMTLVCVATAAFSAWGLYANKIDLAIEPLRIRGLLLLFFLALVAFYQWRRVERLRNLALMTFWAMLVSNLHLFPMFIAARHNVPLSDSLLARFDAGLGLELPAIVSFMHANPFLKACLDITYATLILLMAAAIIIPPLTNQMVKAKEFAIAGMASAIMGILIFAVFKAAGPWIHYGYAASQNQEAYFKVFTALQSDERVTLDVGFREGLICFPSFHAALAILAGWALCFNRYLGWPSMLLALAIVITTVTTGWHYIADTLGGVVLAVVAILVARGYLWLESSGRQPPDVNGNHGAPAA